jgi:hypothetical protein
VTVLRARDVEARTPEAKGRRIVTARSGGRCEIGVPGLCTRDAGPYVGEFSHRRSQKQGGTWCPSNGLRACRPCHHQYVEKEYALAALAGLRVPSGLITPTRTPAWIRTPYTSYEPDWWFLLPDGTYDSWHALDAALALGFPELPDYRRTA